MYASLDRIDLVAELDDGEAAVQTDHRTTAGMAAQLDLSTIFVLVRALNALADPRIRQVVFEVEHAPPPALIEAMRSCGAALRVGGVAVHADGAVQVDVVAGLAHIALRRIGQAVFARAGVEVGIDGLKALEHEAMEARTSLRADDDPVAWWTWVVELAAATGEVLLGNGSFRWVPIEQGASYAVVPFLLDGDQGKFNVFGRCERFMERGREHRPSMLTTGFDPAELRAGPPMLKLVAAGWQSPKPVLVEALIEGDDPQIPRISYGRDLPDAFAYTRAAYGEPADFASLRAEALPTLERVEVQVETLADVIVVVHGDYYASEKLLDPTFMGELHERLGAELLAAAIPVRGILAVVNGAEVSHVAALKQFVALQQEDVAEAERLSAALFGVHEGRPLAVVSLGAQAEQ